MTNRREMNACSSNHFQQFWDALPNYHFLAWQHHFVMLIRPIQEYVGVKGTLRNMRIVKMRSEKFGLAMKFCRVPDLLIFSTSVWIVTLWIISWASAQLQVVLQGIGRCNQTHDLPLNKFLWNPGEKIIACYSYLIQSTYSSKQAEYKWMNNWLWL